MSEILSPERSFRSKKAHYFAQFSLHNRTETQKLVEGGLLWKGSEGWRNVAEHNVLAGIAAYTIGELLGLPQSELTELTSVAATHDWDKRIDKEKIKISEEKTERGEIQYDVAKLMQLEGSKSGLVRVTSDDWRDRDSWGLKEKVLRFVDSSLGQNSEGHAQLVQWKERMADLKVRHAELDRRHGAELYGMPLFDKLAEITNEIESELYEIICSRKPELGEKYSSPNLLSELINHQIVKNIENGTFSGLRSKNPKAVAY